MHSFSNETRNFVTPSLFGELMPLLRICICVCYFDLLCTPKSAKFQNEAKFRHSFEIGGYHTPFSCILSPMRREISSLLHCLVN